MNLSFFTKNAKMFALAVVFFAASLASFGQSTRGELAGAVNDSTGAAIPNAAVTATNDATGSVSDTVSSSSGAYHFTALPIGNYTIRATAPGFSASVSNGVTVLLNSTTALNITLQAGAVTDTISVDASGVRVEAESSDLGGTIAARQITELPLAIAGGVGALRSPENFVFLVPGTTGPGSGGAQGLQGNGVFFSKLGGGQAYGAEILLDGASVTRSENGSSFDETAPSVEALQEFKVTTSTPTAEFGRTTAGIESFATKAGGNLYHGTAFDIFKNEVLDANGWFQTGLRVNCAPGDITCLKNNATPADKKNDFGGSMGGPVIIPHFYNGKDKTFFFFSWEQFRQTLSLPTQATVPTAAERAGDFSGVLGGPTGTFNLCTGDPILQNQIFDPATSTTTPDGKNSCRLPFAGNIIPTDRFSSAATALLATLPAPNQAGTPNLYGFYNNYALSPSYPLNNTTTTVRIDQVFSDRDRIFVSYSSRDNVRGGANSLPLPYGNVVPQNFVTHYTRAGWDHTFSPTLLNHLNLGYNRTNSFNYAPTLGGKNYSAEAGIANVNSTAFPLINFDGLDSFTAFANGQNGDNIDNGMRVNDSISYQKGRHSIKVGIDLRYQQYSTLQKSIPTFNFARSETDAIRVGGTPQLQSGNSFASFLLGLPDYGSQTAYIHSPRWNSKYVVFFFQDDWKVAQNLTLNLGVRYDIDFPRKEAETDTSNFSLSAPDPHADGLPGALIFGQTCHCNSAWADTYYKDIAPRIGFAYQVPGSHEKTVIRGGGALIYGPLQYDDFGSAMTTGYNVPVTASVGDGFTPAFQLDSGFPKPFPTAPNLDPGQLDLGAGSFGAVSGAYIAKKDGRPSVTYNWSLQVQQELAQDLIFTIGYIGQSAQNLRSALENINNIPLSAFSYGNHLNDPITPGHPADGVNAPYSTFNGQLYRAIRPFPQYDYIATDCCLQNVGHSSYNALVSSLNRRFRNGVNLTASYTWQKNETDADSALANTNPGGLQQDQDVYDHKLEKSVSYQNIPHTVVFSYLLELPFGKDKRFLSSGALLNRFVGGWQIGGVQRYQSGQPVSFGCATGIPGYQNCIRFSRGPAPLANPAYTKNKHRASSTTGISWFGKTYDPNAVTDNKISHGNTFTADINQAAFIDRNDQNRGLRDPDAPFALGSGIPRVTEEVTSPLYLSEDFSLIKNFPVKERLSAQLKLEAIDAFNRHNFTLPDVEPNDGGTFGIPLINSQNLGPRTLQITGRITF